MGLLDDAIREHLELKRLRGADPSEVARLEREALGPARRGAAATDELTGDESLDAQPFDADRAGDHPLVDDSDTLIPESETLIPDSEPSTLGQDTAEIDMQTVIHEHEHEDEDEEMHESFEHEPAPRHPEPPAASEPPAGAHDETPEGDDVLEETPSFLQQTPEHDQLWFEQQPPRDFDFDK
jgi:hypothetical protein